MRRPLTPWEFALVVVIASNAKEAWGLSAQSDRSQLGEFDKWVSQGLITKIRVAPDPTVALLSVTTKFIALPLEKGAVIADRMCTVISRLSQAKGRDPDTAVGMCELVMTDGSHKIGDVTFDDEGHAMTRWEPWYLRVKK